MSKIPVVSFLLLPLGFVLLPSAAASASTPWLDAEPLEAPASELAEAARALPVADDADVLIVYRRTHFHYDPAGRRSHEEHTVYRLLTPAGAEEWDRIDAAWSPWHQERPLLRARVVAADGRVHRLSETTLSDRPVADGDPVMFGDRRVLEAPLPAVTVGAVVETWARLRDREPFFAAGVATSMALVSTAPIAHAEVVVEAPPTVPLRHRIQLGDQAGVAVEESAAEGRRRIRIAYRDLPAAGPAPSNLPSDQPRWPMLRLATGRSWRHVARAYAEVVDRQLEGSAPAVATLMPDDAGGTQADQIASMLAAVNARVRYTGLELGEASLVPAPPADVLERRFGDCKDQATLLVAMLRRQGIPAYVALLHAGTGRDVDPELPGLGGFNHAIVHVPGLRPLWIDPTDPFARIGELPRPDRDRWALVAASTTEGLIKTPGADSADHGTTEIREVHLAPLGAGRVVETTIYRGDHERRQRANHQHASPKQRRERYAQYVASTYVGAELGTFEEVDVADLGQPYTLRLEALATGRAATDLDQAAVGIPLAAFVFDMPEAFFGEPATPREHPFVHAPFRHAWQYRIHLLPGFEPQEVPEDQTRELGAATLTTSYRLLDRVMHADYTFDSGPAILDADTFETTRAALREMAEDDEVVVLRFDSTAVRFLQSGDVGSAVALLEASAASASGETAAIERLRLARILAAVGLRRAAVAEAERAVASAPERSEAHQVLGELLLHDAVGRQWGSHAIDRPRSLHHLEKAVALDPDNAVALGSLILALERDDQGVQYGAGADLDRAIEEARRFRDHFDSSGADAALSALLARRERGEDLLQLAEEAAEPSTAAVLRLVGTAIVRGHDAALRHAGRLSGTPAERALYLAEAAGLLVAVRRYETASALLRLAAPASENPVETLANADMIGGARPLEDIETPEDPVRDLLLRLLRLVVGNDDPSQAASLLHPALLHAIDSYSDRAAELGELDDWLSAEAENDGIPTEVICDLAFSAIELETAWQAEGLTAVTMRFGTPGEIEDSTLYLADTDQPRILATDEPAEIGLAMLGLLDRNEHAMVRVWLDRLRAEAASPDADDPLAGPAFSLHWQVGDDDPQRMRTVAAILLAEADPTEHPDRLRAALDQLVGALEAMDASDPSWPALAMPTVACQLALEEVDAAVRLTARLVEAVPESHSVQRARWLALIAAEDLAPARAIAEERLASTSDEAERAEAHRWLADTAYQAGDLEQAARWIEQLDPAEPWTGTYVNNLAWARLFDPATVAEGLEVAERATRLAGTGSDATLHTLATAYAANGRPTDAYGVLLQAIAARGGKVEAIDFLVLGLIAEAVGRPADARAYYADAGGADGEHRFSTAALAARRLAALDGAGS